MATMKNVADKICEMIYSKERRHPEPYDTTAEVRRVENGKAYVHLPGGIDETPVALTIDAAAGDMVQVRVADGAAWLVGNRTAPPTDDAEAIAAKVIAEIADKSATQAHEVAEVAETKAVDAKETAEAVLVYDHGYVPDGTNPNIKHFTAYLYQGGVDVKTKFSPEQFTWYLKTEDGEVYKGSGYTKDFNIEECGYGAEVIGKFTITDDSDLLTSDDDTLTDNDDTPYTVRASGESVRVSELSLATTIYDEEKLMVVGNEDEHLVTMSKLYEYISDKFADDMGVLYCGTATEVVG